LKLLLKNTNERNFDGKRNVYLLVVVVELVVLLVSVVVEIVVEVGTVSITLFAVASKYKFIDF
jgi:hypothetical protein